MNSLSLSKRGLLLVAVPLVFQAVIVVALAALLLNLHAQILKEQRSRDLESGLFSAILNSADDFMLPTASYISDAHGDAKESARKAVSIASRFESLIKIAEKEPGNQESVKKIRQYSKEFATACSEGVERRGHWGPYREQIQSSALLLLQEAKKLIDIEEKRRRESPVSSRALRGQVALLLLAAVLFSVIFAILTAYGYAGGIRGPLDRIRRNSRLLAERSELLPLSHDCPEIDALDQRLHEVAQSANAALAHERAMIDNARDLICSLDESGGFSAANAYARAMLGINPEELIGQHLTDLAVAEDSMRADQYVQNAFKTPEISKFELRLQGREKAAVHARLSGFRPQNEKTLFCVIHDITEERNADRIRQEFVDMVHDHMRKPLNAVLSTLENIEKEDGASLSDDANEEVTAAIANLATLVGLVNNLIGMEKLDTGKIELELADSSIDNLIADAIGLVTELAQQRHVRIETPTCQHSVTCDRQKMVQVIVNLLSNAIKFSPEGALVSLVVQEVGSFIEVDVEDEGPGVPESEREKIFAQFHQLERNEGQGTGLGLAICKLIVEAHGGSIGVAQVEASDAVKSGSRFWLRLPLKR